MPYFKDPNGGLHYLDDVAFIFLLPSGSVEITDAEAYAIQHPQPTAAQLNAELIASAKSSLAATDLVALRCWKSSVAYPADWLNYTNELRAIVNSTDTTSTALPTQPAYPAGT